MSLRPLGAVLAALLALPAGAAKVAAPIEASLPSGAAPAASAAGAALVAPAPLLAPALTAAPTAAPAAAAALPVVAPAPAPILTQAAKAVLPRAGERKGSASHSSRQAGELRALYDGGSAASVPDDAPRENPGRAAAPLAPSRPEASAAPRAPPASPPARAASRFPLRRGEITWKEAWRLANPASDANTVRAGFKSARERERESAMYRHNLGYLLGFQPYDFQKTEALKRDAERRRVLAERGARVRAAYGLPEFTSLSPPAAVLGRRLGAGGQGEAFLSATRPGYAVKTFRGATGEQLQEMAAILNAVADQGQPVARVRLVKIADGGYGLEMPEYSRADGWMDLATFVRFHRRAPEARAAESQAEEALRAVGRESERVLGVDAADWKAGLDGVVSDDHLENFMFNRKTGKIVGFDPLVKW